VPPFDVPLRILVALGEAVTLIEAARAKLAVTAAGEFPVTVHIPAPVQPAVQPAKVEPVAGTALKTSTEPAAKVAEQVAPQAMPAGSEVMVPSPSPDLLTVTGNVALATSAQLSFEYRE
jgi:hypothetical protein